MFSYRLKLTVLNPANLRFFSSIEAEALQKAILRSVKQNIATPVAPESLKQTQTVKLSPSVTKEQNSPNVFPHISAALNPAAVSNLKEFAPKICVIGVGGGGCNAVNNMIARGLVGVDFVCANTDAQHLATTLAENKLQLGREATQGLGCGANPESG